MSASESMKLVEKLREARRLTGYVPYWAKMATQEEGGTQMNELSEAKSILDEVIAALKDAQTIHYKGCVCLVCSYDYPDKERIDELAYNEESMREKLRQSKWWSKYHPDALAGSEVVSRSELTKRLNEISTNLIVDGAQYSSDGDIKTANYLLDKGLEISEVIKVMKGDKT